MEGWQKVATNQKCLLDIHSELVKTSAESSLQF